MRSFVFTNVDKDGLLGGPDLDEVRRVASVVRGRFMYSGGIGRREDLEALAALREVNLTGVIVGKALYERRFTVAEGLAALAGSAGDADARCAERRRGAAPWLALRQRAAGAVQLHVARAAAASGRRSRRRRRRPGRVDRGAWQGAIADAAADAAPGEPRGRPGDERATPVTTQDRGRASSASCVAYRQRADARR